MNHQDILNLVHNSGIDPNCVCDQVGFIKVLQKHAALIGVERCSTICHTPHLSFLKTMVVKTRHGVLTLSGQEGWSDIEQHQIAQAQQKCFQETGMHPTAIEFSHEPFSIDIFQQDTSVIENMVETVFPKTSQNKLS